MKPDQDETALLQAAYIARGRQLAELRARLAEFEGAAEAARADATAHGLEARAQRERAERAEQGANALQEHAARVEAELRRTRAHAQIWLRLSSWLATWASQVARRLRG
jgi:hypothetical protein